MRGLLKWIFADEVDENKEPQYVTRPDMEKMFGKRFSAIYKKLLERNILGKVGKGHRRRYTYPVLQEAGKIAYGIDNYYDFYEDDLKAQFNELSQKYE